MTILSTERSLFFLLIALLTLPPAILLAGEHGYSAMSLLSLLRGDTTSISDMDYLVLTELRLPRLFAGLLVGAALGCAGCLLQRMTANPLASPGLLGLNQGAALGLVCLIISPLPFLPLYAFIAALSGAFLAMVLVFGVVRITTGAIAAENLLLFGALLSTLFGALTTVALILDQHALDAIRFWLAGSLSLIERSQIGPLAALVLTGLILAVFSTRSLQLLESGHDTARGLGANPRTILIMVSAIILILTATSVAVSGPILFIGLIVPHLARLWIGERILDQLLGSTLLGALLLPLADFAVFLLDSDDRIPPGVALAILGVPWFMWLVKRRYRNQ
ncbi:MULTISPECIES: iron ABC transporter permease [unclassified Marinomonas]|uniref:FecCD family ABC transporter permease n=1 Tax=unclassified Marinomonas TaxID=196814 RepID=UPI000CB1496A|nr:MULTISPECIES: iron ABC transporter permease [unclassified Marinomonas]PJE53599.1 hypothetical protein TY87_20005 [Marinomonas sp. BSi20584]